MPPRYIVIAIVGFWVATTGWLFYRDLWPRLRPGGPPPFTIDLADEATEQKIGWTIYIDGQSRGYARTSVQYRPEDDTFELSGEYRMWSGKQRHSPPDEDIKSVYRVTRDGELLEIDARVYKSFSALGVGVAVVDGSISGRVQNGKLVPRLKASVGGRQTDVPPQIDCELAAIDVPHRGSMLNPFQPLNKVRGLKPGQRWRMPYFDPLEAIGKQILPGGSTDQVDAEVLRVEPLPDIPLKDQGPNMPNFVPGGTLCLPVQYVADDVTARCWIRESDGTMMRQEVSKGGQTIILNRDFLP